MSLVCRHTPNTEGRPHRRLAVPFRAADLPSDRSEWAQPDTAILFTVLSHYEDGLSVEQLQQALQALEHLGIHARQEVYNRWLQCAAVPAGERVCVCLLAMVLKVLENALLPSDLCVT